MNDPIKQKIQELCPDVLQPNCNPDISADHFCSNCDRSLPDRITLAVVLRAVFKDRKNIMMGMSDTIISRWNLTHDDYDKQSDETRAFIGQLLGV